MKLFFPGIAAILLLCCCSGCSDSDPELVAQEKSLEAAFLSLFGTSKTPEILESVEVDINGRRRLFNNQTGESSSLKALKETLSSRSVSGNDPALRRNSTRMQRVGSIVVKSNAAQLKYEIFRSVEDHRLMCIKVPLVGDSTGSALLYLYSEHLPSSILWEKL